MKRHIENVAGPGLHTWAQSPGRDALRKDLVTLALGARFRVNEWLDLGVAYEFPLTDKEKGMIESRFMVDAILTLHF